MPSRDVNISVVVAVPRYQNSDKFLAVKRSEDRENSPGLWEFPSGKAEGKEITEEAALRELEEETGLTGELKGVCDHHERTVENKSVRFYPYLVEVESRDVELSDEHSEYKWIDRDKVSDLYRHDNFDNILESARNVKGDVAIAVLRENDDYLVLRRSEHESFSGRWEFAGGVVEEETVDRAALRELEEETNLDARIIKEGHPYIAEGSTGFWKLHPFLLEPMADNQEIKLSKEHDEYKWARLGELENLDTMGQEKGLKSLELI